MKSRRYDPAIVVLILCTGNICRSPMAMVLLAERLQKAGVAARVSSAGLLGDGRPASPNGVTAMARRALDLSAHSSRRFTAEMIRDSDVVIGMERHHVREAVVVVPEAFEYTFTLKELVRRAEAVGPPGPGESLKKWLSRLHGGRRTVDLMGDDPADDVADPIGQAQPAYDRTAAELEDLVDRLVAAGLGAFGAGPARGGMTGERAS